MTLEQFFTRCMAKITEANDADTNSSGQSISKSFGSSYQYFNVLLSESKRGEYKSHSAIRSSWSYVLDATRGTDFWDEFKGDEELKEALKEFLGGE